MAQHLATKPDPYPWDSAKQLPNYSITRLIVSPMSRTMQTGKPIAEALRLKPEIWYGMVVDMRFSWISLAAYLMIAVKT